MIKSYYKIFIYSALLLFVPLTNVYGQSCRGEGGTDCILQYDDFSGGLNTRISPFSLPKSQGDIVENVRIDTEYKSLTKRDKTVIACKADATSPLLGLHRFYLKDQSKVTLANYSNKVVTCTTTPSVILTTTTADKRWDWLTWHDIAIGTDGTNQPVKYDGTSSSATYLGSALATDSGSGTGMTGSDYRYKISCYSATKEHIFDQESNMLDMTGSDMTLTMIPICPDTITGESTTGRKVYRVKSNGSTFFLLSNGSIADNTSVTLTDSDADGDLTGTSYPAGDATVRPPLGRFVLVHKNRLWLSNNADRPSTTYYSEDASHDYFLSTALFNVRPNDGDEITCTKNWLGLLTVGKTNTWQKIDTRKDTPSSDWEITDPFNFIGVHAPYSCVATDLGIMYLGNNGIYTFTGQYSELISDPITPEIRDISTSNFPNVWAAYFKNSYYMAYTSISTGASVNDKILVIDLIDKAFSTDILNVNVLHVFGSGSDVEALYSGGSDSGKIFAHTESLKEVIHKRHADFDGTFQKMRFIPTSVGGVANDPVIEVSWTATIDSTDDHDWKSTIDSVPIAIIDRQGLSATYDSQKLVVNASALDKIYWNETFPSGGGDITFDIRSGATADGIDSVAYVTGFTDSSGSDISSATADAILQYRINMSTTKIDETPTLFKSSNFVVRITYDVAGITEESTIPVRWRSGWLDFGYPGFVKELWKIYVYYEWPANTAGTLNLKFDSLQGETDSFAIDLLENPDYFIEYFPDGNMVGELIRLDITESSLNPIKIEKIIVIFNVQNLT